jgi:hypothetical protein
MLKVIRYFPVRTLDWLEEHSRWKDLKTLGSSNLVRASVLMPAFGYMLLLNENVHQYLTIKYDGWLLNYLPNVWRIWLLFYGSFFLAAATILYTAEVKAYENGYAMAELEAKHYINMNEARVVQDRVKWLFDHMPKWMWPYFDRSGLNFQASPSGMINPTGYFSKFFIHEWFILNMWHRGLRCLLLVLYAVGLTLIAVPAVFTFLQVTWIPVKHIFW